MNAKNPKPGPAAATSAPASGAAALPAVKVVKRQAVEDVPALREKACSECGRAFKLTPEQKFHLCPRCYQKAQAKRPATRRGTSVLTQITCVECGAQEYLSMVPTDPAKALCAACHTAHRAATPREPKPRPKPSNSR